MNDPMSASERQIEERLRQSFPASDMLSPDFEDRVMASIRQHAEKSRRSRNVGRIMMIYWAISSVLVAVLLGLGSASGGSDTLVSASLVASLVVGASLMLLARQSRLRIAELFFTTMR